MSVKRLLGDDKSTLENVNKAQKTLREVIHEPSDLNDVSVRVGDTLIRCARSILIVYSAYFKAQHSYERCVVGGGSDETGNVIEVPDDLSVKAVEFLIQAFYFPSTIPAEASPVELANIFQAYDVLQVQHPHLKRRLFNFVVEHKERVYFTPVVIIAASKYGFIRLLVNMFGQICLEDPKKGNPYDRLSDSYLKNEFEFVSKIEPRHLTHMFKTYYWTHSGTKPVVEKLAKEISQDARFHTLDILLLAIEEGVPHFGQVLLTLPPPHFLRLDPSKSFLASTRALDENMKTDLLKMCYGALMSVRDA